VKSEKEYLESAQVLTIIKKKFPQSHQISNKPAHCKALQLFKVENKSQIIA